MKYWILGLIIILMYGMVNGSRAERLDSELAAELWGLSWSLTHFIHQGDRSTMVPPKMYYTTPQVLCTRAKMDYPCGLRAMEQQGAVFFDETLDFGGPYARSILIHEFVHVVQTRMRGNNKSCRDSYRNEAEARMVQVEVLIKSGNFELAHEVNRGLGLYVCR